MSTPINDPKFEAVLALFPARRLFEADGSLKRLRAASEWPETTAQRHAAATPQAKLDEFAALRHSVESPIFNFKELP